MLVDSYKEFYISNKVRVKKNVIYDCLLSNLTIGASSDHLLVIDYAIRVNNQLTIAEIEYNPNLILQTYFSFLECKGYLHYGQFNKCSPLFFILKQSDFKR
jgi:hypothetical protein